MARRYSSREVISILERNGFFFSSQRGSHVKYSSSLGTIVIVPADKKELPPGTFSSIVRQSRLPRTAFTR